MCFKCVLIDVYGESLSAAWLGIRHFHDATKIQLAALFVKDHEGPEGRLPTAV
jgi:hypothetical protein